MKLKEINCGKNKIITTINLIILVINIILLFLLYTKTVEKIFKMDKENIFYAIDTENIILIKTIVMLNPKIVIEKNKELEFSRQFAYLIPLMYAADRNYPQKDIIMFLLEKTNKYYKNNYFDENEKTNEMNELNIVLYNIFKISLNKAYDLNPYLFKDYPDYDIPDKILELGFPINYFFNINNYWNIKDWVLESPLLTEEDRIRIKEYLISKGLIFNE